MKVNMYQTFSILSLPHPGIQIGSSYIVMSSRKVQVGHIAVKKSSQKMFNNSEMYFHF